eukprot:6461412-Amphidinium_carterae.2
MHSYPRQALHPQTASSLRHWTLLNCGTIGEQVLKRSDILKQGNVYSEQCLTCLRRTQFCKSQPDMSDRYLSTFSLDLWQFAGGNTGVSGQVLKYNASIEEAWGLQPKHHNH